MLLIVMPSFRIKITLPTRAVKKINKDRFLSISLLLSIIDKNFNLLIVKKTFLEKMGKKIFGGHDHFLGKEVILH